MNIMNNPKAARSSTYSLRCVLVLCLSALLALGIFGLSGCGAPADNTTENEQSSLGNENQVTSETVTGTITKIDSTELLIEVPANSNDFLQGDIRVDLSQSDSMVIEGLKVGDTIVVQYSGQVGMSEPPFISATSIEIEK